MSRTFSGASAVAETGVGLALAPALTPDEDRGLANALSSLRAGEGRTLDEVRQTIDSIARR